MNTFPSNSVQLKPCSTKNCGKFVKYFLLANITNELLAALLLKFSQPQKENKLMKKSF